MITCTNCGHSFPDDSKFCPQCGTAVALSKDTPAAQDTTEHPTKRRSKSILMGIFAFALILILIIIFSVRAASNKSFIAYVADDEVYVASGKQYKPVLAFDDKYEFVGSFSFASQDGTKLLVTDEDGGLFYLDTKSKSAPVKLSSDFSTAIASKDFKVFTYIKDDSLYQCDTKGNAIQGEKKIQSKVSQLTAISPSGSIIYYLGEDDNYYVKVGRNAPEEIVSKVEGKILGTSEDYKTIYYLVDETTLCMKAVGKEAVELAENVMNIYDFTNYPMRTTDGSFYILTGEPTTTVPDAQSFLCYVDDKDVTTISEDLKIGDFYISIKVAADKDAAVVMLTESTTNDHTMYMVVEDQMVQWEEDVDSVYGVTDDGDYVYYTDSMDENNIGDLYRAKVSTKPSAGNLLDEDVSMCNIMPNGKAFYFKDIDDDNHGNLYINGKLISEDVYAKISYISYHEKSGDLMFFTDYNVEKNRGSLCVYTRKTKTVDEDVYSAAFTQEGTICYLKDYKDGEGDLYLSNQRTSIAQDVSDFATSYVLNQYSMYK